MAHYIVEIEKMRKARRKARKLAYIRDGKIDKFVLRVFRHVAAVIIAAGIWWWPWSSTPIQKPLLHPPGVRVPGGAPG